MKTNQLLASESFMANPKRYYFLDFKRSAHNSNYIKLTRSEQQENGSYRRWSLVVFEDHLENFISAFSSLFHSAAYQGKGYQMVMDIAQESAQSKGIKTMPEELRPREKLYSRGAGALSDAELLAILLGAGSPGETAIGLAARILAASGGTLKGLKQSGFSTLCRFKGMGLGDAALRSKVCFNEVFKMQPNAAVALVSFCRGDLFGGVYNIGCTFPIDFANAFHI